MSDEIKVLVKSNGPGRKLVMYYVDPVSEKRVVKTTGTIDPGEAERRAGEWEKELQAGNYRPPSKVLWADFRKRYEEEHLPTLAKETTITATVALDCMERILNPGKLAKLTPAVLSRFQAELRKPRVVEKGGEKIPLPGMKETTIAKTLRHIKAALRWAERVGLMVKAPKIEMPKRVKGKTMMKGRPITGEEYERMLEAVDKVRPHDADVWKRFLTALWLSGLRLSEALALSWDLEKPFMVDFAGRRPVFRIRGEAQKSGRDELCPMTPDFAEWLQAIYPDAERVGRVLKIDGMTDSRHIGRIISDIGEKAGVVVNREAGKFASAHDLRRAFGTRWANRVKPATLKLLMRHAVVTTTMDYYVSQDAADIADELWENHGITCGITRQKPTQEHKQNSATFHDANYYDAMNCKE